MRELPRIFTNRNGSETSQSIDSFNELRIAIGRVGIGDTIKINSKWVRGSEVLSSAQGSLFSSERVKDSDIVLKRVSDGQFEDDSGKRYSLVHVFSEPR